MQLAQPNVATKYPINRTRILFLFLPQRRQRAAWEDEFSSCANPMVILPPAGVSRRRARGSNSNSNNGGGSSGSGDRGNEPKSVMGLGARSSIVCFDKLKADTQDNRHHYQHHQQRWFSLDQGPEEQQRRTVGAHSLGSAKFFFDRALEHHHSDKPGSASVGQWSSTGSGLVAGSKDPRRDSTLGGTNDSNSCSSFTRWGNERAVLKGLNNPYRLAGSGTRQQQYQEHDNGYSSCREMTGGSTVPTTAKKAATTAETSRGCTNTMRIARGATENAYKITTTTTTTKAATIAREGVLCRSTWLGPEVSPLQNNEDAARLKCPSPYSIQFAAAAWPNPKRNRRWRGATKGINSYRGAKQHGGGNLARNSGGSRGDSECGVRQQRKRGSFQQYVSCKGGTDISRPGREPGPQVRGIVGGPQLGQCMTYARCEVGRVETAVVPPR